MVLHQRHFPMYTKTISEADTVHMDEVFQRILSNPIIDWAGFLAFFALATFALAGFVAVDSDVSTWVC